MLIFRSVLRQFAAQFSPSAASKFRRRHLKNRKLARKITASIGTYFLVSYPSEIHGSVWRAQHFMPPRIRVKQAMTEISSHYRCGARNNVQEPLCRRRSGFPMQKRGLERPRASITRRDLSRSRATLCCNFDERSKAPDRWHLRDFYANSTRRSSHRSE